MPISTVLLARQTLSAETLWYYSVQDGVCHGTKFKRGDLVIDLWQPVLDRVIYDRNVCDVIARLFDQDYGTTASSLFDKLPDRHSTREKKVPLAGFITRWNGYHAQYARSLKDFARAGNTTRRDINRLLGAAISRGEEPWMYAQTMTLEEITGALCYAGIALEVAELTRQRQRLTLVQGHCIYTLKELALPELRVLTSRGGQQIGSTLYLVAMEDTSKPEAVDQSLGGVVFYTALADGGADQILACASQGLAKQVEEHTDVRFGVLKLGRVVGGEFVYPLLSEWTYHSLSGFKSARGEAPVYVPERTSKRARGGAAGGPKAKVPWSNGAILGPRKTF